MESNRSSVSSDMEKTDSLTFYADETQPESSSPAIRIIPIFFSFIIITPLMRYY